MQLSARIASGQMAPAEVVSLYRRYFQVLEEVGVHHDQLFEKAYLAGIELRMVGAAADGRSDIFKDWMAEDPAEYWAFVRLGYVQGDLNLALAAA